MQEQCAVCGNKYDQPIEVKYQGKSYIFDSFECAIHAIAPECENCGVKIAGHGLQSGEHMYCCAHCARAQGEKRVTDRADDATEQSASPH